RVGSTAIRDALGVHITISYFVDNSYRSSRANLAGNQRIKRRRIVGILHVALEKAGPPAIDRVEITKAHLAANFGHMLTMHNRDGICEVRVLTLDPKQSAIAEVLCKSAAEVSQTRTARSFQ